ncbi:hypothetical protein AOQ84DRAFT_192290 [Glonium stellatum]|uniref:Uncharacterized protein n=1 Tax=Glonium stellatum TaxID=574774 RepID=A0A8E2F6H5_9PEZI|nr:hypothetical protein AOQ84DRAFT_192290 [Glonium stellatum]
MMRVRRRRRRKRRRARIRRGVVAVADVDAISVGFVFATESVRRVYLSVKMGTGVSWTKGFACIIPTALVWLGFWGGRIFYRCDCHTLLPSWRRCCM